MQGLNGQAAGAKEPIRELLQADGIHEPCFAMIWMKSGK